MHALLIAVALVGQAGEAPPVETERAVVATPLPHPATSEVPSGSVYYEDAEWCDASPGWVSYGRPPGCALLSGYCPGWGWGPCRYPAFCEAHYRHGYNYRVLFDYPWRLEWSPNGYCAPPYPTPVLPRTHGIWPEVIVLPRGGESIVSPAPDAAAAPVIPQSAHAPVTARATARDPRILRLTPPAPRSVIQ